MVKPILALQTRPELATHCYFVAHQRRADVLWSRNDFRALCHRMLNGNSEHTFLLCYRDKQGSVKFSKARTARASKCIDWAFDTICGTQKVKTGIGFYPINGDDESCWGALDFDAHDRNERIGRAYAYAGKAFDLLCREAPQLFVIAGTSGESGGWHIFIFAQHFYSTGDWSRLLREVADRIGAPVEKGVCEVFPDDGARGLGYGIRAPGTWNPKDDSFGLIGADSVTPWLKQRPALRCGSDKEDTSLSSRLTTWEKKGALPSRGFFRGEHGQWKQQFAITAPRSRHEKLAGLVGTAFFQARKEVAAENARLQYAEANPAPGSSLDMHSAEFEELWAGMERHWRAELAPVEGEQFDGLTTGTMRYAFRIIRNWSKKTPADPDFKIVCESLAERLNLSVPAASNIRRRFCSLGILRQTAPYVPHKRAARYEWLASVEPKRKQAGLLASQWNGDPGDVRLKRTKTPPQVRDVEINVTKT